MQKGQLSNDYVVKASFEVAGPIIINVVSRRSRLPYTPLFIPSGVKKFG